MPTAVVTGGAGFLGSHLCEYLLEHDYAVVCVDNLETSSLQNIEHIRSGSFEFVNHDMVDHLQLAGPVDAVFHLASPASPIDYLRLPLHTLKVGSYGTHNALGLAKFKRARFMLASTSEVYGDPKVHPQPETYWGNVNPIGPRGVYDEAKRYAEALTMAYHRQQGVDTRIVRIFNTYGPRMRSHDGRAIPTFMRQALVNQPLTVFGEGSQTRSFCYVDDLIRGFVLLVESGEHMPVNLGNPNEFTILELAQAVIEVTGSKSEIVYEALPVDDPQVRQPDITRARTILGWEPEISLEEGLRRILPTLQEQELVGVRKRLALVGALAFVLAGVGATSAPAAKTMQIGMQDDAQFLFGNPDVAFPFVKLLRVGVVRANLYWGGVHAVAKRRPVHPMDPNDPAYDWGPYDRAVFYAVQERARVMFTILATPSWANGNHAVTKAPTSALDLQRFAYAAAKRYSGTFAAADGRFIPPVRLWEAWNEPNAPSFLSPQYAISGGRQVIQSAKDYAKICNAVYAGVHGTLLGAEKVGCGATSPRGNNNPNSLRPSVAPVAFLRAAKAAGMKKFDAYTHHPYYQGPSDTPASVPKVSTAIILGNINVLIKEVTRLYGAKRIWITEYGYQTNPPDRTFGVTYAKQALYLKQSFAIARANPRIDLMVWFLLRDEGRIGTGWQSGLLSLSGARKPAFAAFQKLPH